MSVALAAGCAAFILQKNEYLIVLIDNLFVNLVYLSFDEVPSPDDLREYITHSENFGFRQALGIKALSVRRPIYASLAHC